MLLTPYSFPSIGARVSNDFACSPCGLFKNSQLSLFCSISYRWFHITDDGNFTFFCFLFCSEKKIKKRNISTLQVSVAQKLNGVIHRIVIFSTFLNMSSNTGHSANFDDFKILSSCSDTCELMIHESLLISKLKPSLNVQGSPIPLNLL